MFDFAFTLLPQFTSETFCLWASRRFAVVHEKLLLKELCKVAYVLAGLLSAHLGSLILCAD